MSQALWVFVVGGGIGGGGRLVFSSGSGYAATGSRVHSVSLIGVFRMLAEADR